MHELEEEIRKYTAEVRNISGKGTQRLMALENEKRLLQERVVRTHGVSGPRWGEDGSADPLADVPLRMARTAWVDDSGRWSRSRTSWSCRRRGRPAEAGILKTPSLC